MAAARRTIEEYRCMPRSGLVLVLMFALPLPTAIADEAVTIRSAVASLSQGRTVVVSGDPICASRPLPLFYTRRQFVPAWSARDGDELLATINDAGSDGLDPAEYHLA